MLYITKMDPDRLPHIWTSVSLAGQPVSSQSLRPPSKLFTSVLRQVYPHNTFHLLALSNRKSHPQVHIKRLF